MSSAAADEPGPTRAPLRYHHVDVFTRAPLSGNGLVVYPDARGVDPATMLRLAQEMNQFESIFLEPEGRSSTEEPLRVRARIFTVEEELDFAGHPILGAGAVLHALHAPGAAQLRLTMLLSGAREVPVVSRAEGDVHLVAMDQGAPRFGPALGDDDRRLVAEALGLSSSDLDDLPIRVVSTGLPYLIIPVRALERPRIVHPDFGALLARFGAKFSYLLDAARPEGRSWDNAGRAEDPATGSAAGPTAAYLSEAGLAPRAGEVVIHQGRFVGRPSEIRVVVERAGAAIDRVRVEGGVATVARGEIAAWALGSSA